MGRTYWLFSVFIQDYPSDTIEGHVCKNDFAHESVHNLTQAFLNPARVRYDNSS